MTIGLRCVLMAIPVALSLFPSALHAGVPQDGAARLKAAASAFAALTQKTRQQTRPPSLAHPDEAAVITSVLDAEAMIGQPPYAAKDVPTLLDAFATQNTVLKTYSFFTSDPGAVPDTARNTALYQDEMARCWAALLRTAAAVTPAITDFFARLPPEQVTEVRLRGLRQSRLGLVQVLTSAALTLRSPGLRPDNQVILASSLADYGEAIAAVLKHDDRLAVVAAAQSSLSALPEPSKERMRKFIAAVSSDTCEGLCKIE